MTKTCYTCRTPVVWRLTMLNPRSYALACDEHLRRYVHDTNWLLISRVPHTEAGEAP